MGDKFNEIWEGPRLHARNASEAHALLVGAFEQIRWALGEIEKRATERKAARLREDDRSRRIHKAA